MNMTALKINTSLCLGISFLLGVMIGYVDFYAPEVQPTILLLLLVAGGLGFVNPGCASRIALVAGIGIPMVHTFALSRGIKPNYPTNGFLPVLLLPLIPSFIGAYSGVFLRKLASHL